MGIVKKLADQEYVAQEVTTKVSEAMEQFNQSSLLLSLPITTALSFVQLTEHGRLRLFPLRKE